MVSDWTPCLPADLTVREVFLADSVRWWLDRADPGTRIVLAAHNNHIQRTELTFDGGLRVLPMGYHLARALGHDYLAIAATSTADHVPEMIPDQNAPAGFTVADTPIGRPEPGSIEAAAVDAGLGDRITLTGLRDAPPIGHIRSQSSTLRLSVPDSFDAVLTVPTTTLDDGIAFR